MLDRQNSQITKRLLIDTTYQNKFSHQSKIPWLVTLNYCF